MSRVKITEIKTGDDVDVSAPNATITSWNNRSSDIDASNVREEGFDNRTVPLRAITPSSGRDRFYATGTFGMSASGTIVTEPSEVAGVPVDTVNLTYDGTDGDMMLVRASFEIHNVAAGTSGPLQSLVARLVKSTDGGTNWSSVPVTTRKFKLGVLAVSGRGSCTIAHYFFDGSLNTNTLRWGLQLYKESGTGSADCGGKNFALTAKTFHR